MRTMIAYLAATIHHRLSTTKQPDDRGSISAEGIVLAAGLIVVAMVVVAFFGRVIAAKLDTIHL